MVAHMENLEGDHYPIEFPEGGLKDESHETDLGDFDNPFYYAGNVDNVV